MPQLSFYRDGREVLRFPLTADVIRLGRHSDNDISLPDPEISRFHAILKRQEDTYYLENCSRVGTRLQGQEVERVALNDQDIFEIGSWRILYERDLGIEEAETTVGKDAEPPARLPMFCGIVGQSTVMKAVFQLTEKGAKSPLSVIIQGETGTGKELVARAIHTLSGVRGSFVALNCGAISPNLIESELFGHERGAFTGAVGQHRGNFEQADGGTLFLDEVGELPIDLQPKLLRVLEEGTFRRVGGSTDIKSGVRIVAATHRDLIEEIRERRFREDLYYRLVGLPIKLPPLRERVKDIPLLVQHFLMTASPGKVSKELTDAALQKLVSYTWPGNVRELRNVLARSLLLCSSSVLDVDDLHFLEAPPPQGHVSLDGLQKEAIVAALEATKGNKRKAADRLGIAKSTLFRKLKDYDIS